MGIVISRGPQCYEWSRLRPPSVPPRVYTCQCILLVYTKPQVQLSSVIAVLGFRAALSGNGYTRGGSLEPRSGPLFTAVTYRPT